ncbi:Ferric reduction oxidase 7, chloroplastic [Linum perenne]
MTKLREPLISNGDDADQKLRPTTAADRFRSFAKWVLKISMWVIFIVWVTLIFLFPTDLGNDLVFHKWTRLTQIPLFGITGSLLLLLAGPVLLIALLAAAHLIISGEGEHHLYRKKSWKYPRPELWTFPVFVDGPLGVVSATELIGVVLFVGYIVWALYLYTVKNLALLSTYTLTHTLTLPQFSMYLMELTGLRLGMIGMFCLAFLFLPISRGSMLLRIIDIPVEHATRYHVWLGHVTMVLFTLHGLFYVVAWAVQGKLLQEILEWKNTGISNLAGVIALVAGLLMWLTSLNPVRRWNFELFFYTHQLYIVFVLFLAFHVGDFLFTIAAGGIFLFILDRFLRFCQSRKTVNVVSAKCFPCGTVELTLSKPANLRYNALSFIFIQVREFSLLQWHPFSVSSSPLEGKNHISVLIKVLGEWTDKLKDTITSNTTTSGHQSDGNFQPSRKITASVEGPYGHESPYHLMYEYLVLVAGGIGISPFMAILSDVFHRVNEGKPCLPREILVVWAVKKSDEIGLLTAMNLNRICSDIFDRLNLRIHIYVTRESDPPLEEGKAVTRASGAPAPRCPFPVGNDMSVLVGTGDNVWSGLYILSSTLGFILLLAIVDAFYINPYDITWLWYKGLLLLLCMVGSVVVFGGAVIGLWHLWGRKANSTMAQDEETNKTNQDLPPNSNPNGTRIAHDLLASSSTSTNYGSRPDFKEIMQSISKDWGHVDVGVMVCGPTTLQSTVAKEIRAHNFRRSSSETVFHFNSHSFDL